VSIFFRTQLMAEYVFYAAPQVVCPPCGVWPTVSHCTLTSWDTSTLGLPWSNTDLTTPMTTTTTTYCLPTVSLPPLAFADGATSAPWVVPPASYVTPTPYPFGQDEGFPAVPYRETWYLRALPTQPPLQPLPFGVWRDSDQSPNLLTAPSPNWIPAFMPSLMDLPTIVPPAPGPLLAPAPPQHPTLPPYLPQMPPSAPIVWSLLSPAAIFGPFVEGERSAPHISRSVLLLPDDVWEIVTVWLELPALRIVKQRLHRLLARRHILPRPMSYYKSIMVMQKLANKDIARGQVHTLALRVPVSVIIVDLLPRLPEALYEMTSLRKLTLQVDFCRLQDEGLAQIAMLAQLPMLQSVALSLRYNGITAAGMATIAQLRHVPSLQQLHLNLSGNVCGDAGAMALAQLRHAPHLQALHLDLVSCGIRIGGIGALLTLHDAPSLGWLHVDISGYHPLAHHNYAPCVPHSAPLRHLCLGVRWVSDPSHGNTVTLSPVAAMRTLRSLRLFLGQLDASGLEDVIHLKDLPVLEMLDLTFDCAGDAAASALAQLRHSRSLTHLEIDVRPDVGEAGAYALATLANCPTLRHLALDVRNNVFGAAGATTLLTPLEKPLAYHVTMNEWMLRGLEGPRTGWKVHQCCRSATFTNDLTAYTQPKPRAPWPEWE